VHSRTGAHICGETYRDKDHIPVRENPAKTIHPERPDDVSGRVDIQGGSKRTIARQNRHSLQNAIKHKQRILANSVNAVDASKFTGARSGASDRCDELTSRTVESYLVGSAIRDDNSTIV
jgi:hypothetical protein